MWEDDVDRQEQQNGEDGRNNRCQMMAILFMSRMRFGGHHLCRLTEGFYVTALYEASDYELMKLYQRERPLPQSEGDRAATSVKTMLGDRRITLHAIHDR
ncbi:hypothetical protein Pla52o_34050 [Novipirellula galeiformis]|uniref:Uncharacterized protein n=1 Tax=Novipirellula galeiformis TaxID=2528004 RepID=A0A5C6CHX6_9BACT|nr:hypothetical protein Pla52o_34050 [Novipirellula galeiformis]